MSDAAVVATVEDLEGLEEVAFADAPAGGGDAEALVAAVLDLGGLLGGLSPATAGPQALGEALYAFGWLRGQLAEVVPALEDALHTWARAELAAGRLPVVAGVGVVKPHTTSESVTVPKPGEAWEEVCRAVLAAPYSRDDLGPDGVIDELAPARRVLRVLGDIFPMGGSTVIKSLSKSRAAPLGLHKDVFVRSKAGRRTVQLVGAKATSLRLVGIAGQG